MVTARPNINAYSDRFNAKLCSASADPLPKESTAMHVGKKDIDQR